MSTRDNETGRQNEEERVGGMLERAREKINSVMCRDFC